jgi:hypothetical protein
MSLNWFVYCRYKRTLSPLSYVFNYTLPPPELPLMGCEADIPKIVRITICETKREVSLMEE